LEPTTPKPRVGHSTAIVGDKVYLFGGFDTHKTYFNGLHMLDLVSGVWEEIKPQDGFAAPSMAYHSCSVVDDKLYIFGGTAAGEKYFNHFFEVTVSGTLNLTLRRGACVTN
jgi:N-acetylneuraminic acid mutarotase